MKTIIRINASLIKSSSCGRFLTLTHLGYSTKGIANDMVYGSAFHKFDEVYCITKDEKQALIAGMEYFSNAEKSGEMFYKDKKKHLNGPHLFLTMSRYLAEKKSGKDILNDYTVLTLHGKVMVEQKFSLKVYEDEQYIVLLQGTIDKLAELHKGNFICIPDWKTTSSWDVEDYFIGYKQSVQLRTYVYAVLKLAAQHPDREASKKVLQRGGVLRAFILGAFLKQPQGVEFHRSEIFKFSQRDMVHYELMLNNLVKEIVYNVRQFDTTGNLPMEEGMMNGACNAPFGGVCKYFGACSAVVGMDGDNTDRTILGILNGQMEKKEYRPLQFGGEGKI